MTIVSVISDRALSADARRFASLLLRYGLSSGAALALDLSVLMLCYRVLGINHLISAAIGFLSGLALIYGLSVRYIFRDRRSVSVRVEIIGFFLTGLAGLALTEILIYIFVDWIGLPVSVSKIPTSVIVFIFNFLVRRALFFSDTASEARWSTQTGRSSKASENSDQRRQSSSWIDVDSEA